MKCPACQSERLSWQSFKESNGVAHNRLGVGDVRVLAVLGCDECSETVLTKPIDEVLALAPPNLFEPQAESHPEKVLDVIARVRGEKPTLGERMQP